MNFGTHPATELLIIALPRSFVDVSCACHFRSLLGWEWADRIAQGPAFFFRTVGLQSWRPPILGDGHQSIRHRKIPIKGFPWHGMTHFYLFDMAWIWSFQHGASACFFQVRANLQVECERRLQEAKCGRAMEDPDFKLGRGPFLEK